MLNSPLGNIDSFTLNLLLYLLDLDLHLGLDLDLDLDLGCTVHFAADIVENICDSESIKIHCWNILCKVNGLFARDSLVYKLKCPCVSHFVSHSSQGSNVSLSGIIVNYSLEDLHSPVRKESTRSMGSNGFNLINSISKLFKLFNHIAISMCTINLVI